MQRKLPAGHRAASGRRQRRLGSLLSVIELLQTEMTRRRWQRQQRRRARCAVVVATALAKAFNTDVNGLPLSFAVSWFEQKAVAVLLTLLHLGVKNIALGPNMPAFLGPEVGTLLNESFGLRLSDVHNVDKVGLYMCPVLGLSLP